VFYPTAIAIESTPTYSRKSFAGEGNQYGPGHDALVFPNGFKNKDGFCIIYSTTPVLYAIPFGRTTT